MLQIPQRLRFPVAMLPGTAFLFVLVFQASRNPYGSRRFTLFDDATISMTYARTLVQTGEFVWFPGAPRVQGFTNPLWTLYMACVQWLGFEDSRGAFVISMTGVFLILSMSWLMYHMCCQIVNQKMSLFIGLLVPFLFPVTFWTLRGMEVGLLAVCAVALLLPLVKEDSRTSWVVAGGASIVGVLTRIDFFVLCVMFVFCFFVFSSEKSTRKAPVFFVATPSLSAVVVVLAVQKLYWGEWLPNTYHLKMGNVSFVDRIVRGLASSAKLLPFIVLLGFVLFRVMSSTIPLLIKRLIICTGLMSLSTVTYAIWIGGDAWEDITLNRFVSVGLPLALLSVFIGGWAIANDRNPWIASQLRRWTFSLLMVISLFFTGINVNPVSWSHKLVVLSFGIIICSLCMSVCFIFLLRRQQQLSALSLCIILTVSFIGMTSASGFVKQVHARDLMRTTTNQWVTETSHQLPHIVKSTGVIATVWAGIPAYYSHRPMIDLLGKSDRRIANEFPRGSFWPGHNKWNYDYSIGELKPDAVYQLWTRGLEPHLESKMASWGYVRRCASTGPLRKSEMYFLASSTNINWGKLTECKTS